MSNALPNVNPKIASMDNDSSFWAVLSGSAKEGDAKGRIESGAFAKAGLSVDLSSPIPIPAEGDTKRLFLQTSSVGYRIYSKGTFAFFETESGAGKKHTVSFGQSYELEIAKDGSPSLTQVS